MWRKKQILVWLIVVAMFLFSLGCEATGFDELGIEEVELGEVQEETRVVELAGDDDIRVKIRFGAGDLLIEGGAEELLEANFIYNIAEWKPQIEYSARHLVIQQPTYKKLAFSDEVRYEWLLRFNDNVSSDLSIDFGAGEAEIDLRHLAVTDLSMKVGAGEVQVDARGNQTLESLNLDLGAGDASLDLRGNWSEDVDVSIQGGLGRTTIVLPQDIGVRVDVTKGIGSIHADGFRIADDAYVNDLYEEAEVVVYLDIITGVGQVNLELD